MLDFELAAHYNQIFVCMYLVSARSVISLFILTEQNTFIAQSFSDVEFVQT